MTLIFFFGGGGGEEVRWKTVRTSGKILATPLIIIGCLFGSCSSVDMICSAESCSASDELCQFIWVNRADISLNPNSKGNEYTFAHKRSRAGLSHFFLISEKSNKTVKSLKEETQQSFLVTYLLPIEYR